MTLLLISTRANHFRGLFAICLLGVWLGDIVARTPAADLASQEQSKQSKGPKRPDDPPKKPDDVSKKKDNLRKGPKRPDDPEIELAPGSEGTLIVRKAGANKNNLPKLPPQMGALVVSAVTQAQVTLTENNQPGNAKRPALVQGGLYFFRALKPGNSYYLEISHDDYSPLKATIKVKPGQTALLEGELVERFGTVIVDIGSLLPRGSFDLTLKVANGEARNDWKYEGRECVFAKVPLGTATLTLQRTGYEKWEEELLVKPGKSPDNKRTANPKRLLAAVVVETEAEAEVYLDADAVRLVRADKRVALKDLEPGSHTLVVSKPGRVKQTLPLMLSVGENPPVNVKLLPATEVASLQLTQPLNPKDWYPGVPPLWRLSVNMPMGIYVAGDTPALVYKTTEPNRTINQYGDFDLVLGVQLRNGKGAAWIVRAQDEHNYYLFELTTGKSTRGLKQLVFYLCRNGNCEEKQAQSVVHALEDQNRSYTLRLRATGGHFQHYIVTPGGLEKELCAAFDDKTYLFGGIGLRAYNGLEMFVDQLSIIPQNP